MNISDIIACDKRIERRQDERKRTIEEFNAKHCPHKIGDVIQVNGCSFDGQRMSVETISLKQKMWKGNWVWKFTGPVINRSGMPSIKNRGECELAVPDEAM